MARKTAQLWLSVLASIAVVTFLAAVGAPFAWYLYDSRDTTPRGPLIGSANWPEPIRDLHSEMVRWGINAEPFEVFLIHGRPGDTISTVICRMPESAPAIDFLRAKLGIDKVPADKLDYIAFVKRETGQFAPPDWWIPDNTNAEYLVSRGILDGSEGDLYVVAHDPQQPRLFIHYYFNF